ncbi:hypothetical protein MIR68_009364 [Amoeboaphelidium protococcarum]|nr:hypothetical protein MIR68_009364 [Amoeboaphelidium protococcarum]
MIAADVRDIKGKMRDSRLAIAKSAASHDLALQMILFMKYASGVVGFLYIVALGLAIASGNLLGIAQMLVGWFSVIPSLMALYLLAKKNIEDHEANLYNETELLRSYDDLLNSKKTD